MNNINSWKWLTGDFNYLEYGGYWYKKANVYDYIVIRLDNIQDQNTKFKYQLSVYEIDLDYHDLKSVCSYCGIEDDDWETLMDLDKLIALASYGVNLSKTYKGNNYRELIHKVSNY